MTETLDQMALRIDTALTNEGKVATSAAYAIEFAKRLVEALNAQEPVATKCGCHCDLEEGMEPDGCVIDDGRLDDCVYAKRVQTKEQCIYWLPIKEK